MQNLNALMLNESKWRWIQSKCTSNRLFLANMFRNCHKTIKLCLPKTGAGVFIQKNWKTLFKCYASVFYMPRASFPIYKHLHHLMNEMEVHNGEFYTTKSVWEKDKEKTKEIEFLCQIWYIPSKCVDLYHNAISVCYQKVMPKFIVFSVYATTTVWESECFHRCHVSFTFGGKRRHVVLIYQILLTNCCVLGWYLNTTFLHTILSWFTATTDNTIAYYFCYEKPIVRILFQF